MSEEKKYKVIAGAFTGKNKKVYTVGDSVTSAEVNNIEELVKKGFLELNKKQSSGPSAAERATTVSEMETVDEIQTFMASETSKGVKDAAAKRLGELESERVLFVINSLDAVETVEALEELIKDEESVEILDAAAEKKVALSN